MQHKEEKVVYNGCERCHVYEHFCGGRSTSRHAYPKWRMLKVRQSLETWSIFEGNVYLLINT